MKAIGYIRVSTQGQAEEGQSLDAQEAKIRAWASVNDATEVLIFRDEGISGKRSDNRPGLQAALDAVTTGDAFITYSLSRLSRSTRDTLEIAEQLQKRGADLVSLSEKIDTTSASGKMIFRLLAVLAEFERDQVADRTRATLQFMKSKGMKTGGDVPFGYTAKDGQLFEDPQEQQAIDDMMKRRATGESYRSIGAAFGRRHPQSIKRILARTGA